MGLIHTIEYEKRTINMKNNFMNEEVTLNTITNELKHLKGQAQLNTIIDELKHLNSQAQELIKSSRDANQAYYSITDSIIVLEEIHEKQS